MRIRLNPADLEDRFILKAEDADELTDRVAVLLKHDWERVKLEATVIDHLFYCVPRPKYEAAAHRPEWKVRKQTPWLEHVIVAAWGLLAGLLGVLFPFFLQDVVSPLFSLWLHAWGDILESFFEYLNHSMLHIKGWLCIGI